MSTIAFIGLGRMGNPMAQNLLASGFNVQIFDVDVEAAK
ncbi:NAD(P)-binding domain-containing protein, partial [Escherichia coli]|nr:NAD(P)-binding domain-containing protein [Escherichia coli]